MDDATEARRIRWHCRRGMKELDVLLERFYAAEFASLDANERAAFCQLLDLEDPVLYDALINRRGPSDPAQARLAARIGGYR